MTNKAKQALFQRYADNIRIKVEQYWECWHKPIAFRYIFAPSCAQIPNKAERDEFKAFLLSGPFILTEMTDRTGSLFCFPAAEKYALDETARYEAMRRLERDTRATNRRSRSELAEERAVKAARKGAES